MSSPRILWPVAPVLAVLAALGLGSSTVAAPATDQPVVVSFVEAGSTAVGESTLVATAVGLRARDLAAFESADILVLVDTSASQAGTHRQRQLEAVQGLLAAARARDRVRIAAVDVGCEPLAPEFAAARSEATAAAIRGLQSRTPLGSTDLTTALETAAGLFPAGSRPKAVVYVGDGPGFAGVDAQEFARVLDLLRSEHVIVSALGIGPQVNWPCLAAVASATGGMLIVPAEGESVADAGKEIAALAVQPVAWPEDVAFAAEQKDLPRILPARFPPLRTDRESVVLLAGSPAASELSFSLAGAGSPPRPVTLAIPAAAPRDDHAYLGILARNAWDTDGVFLPLLGRQGMRLAGEVIRGEAVALAELSKQAEASGAHASAVRLAEASLRRDPDNPQAAVVRLAAARQAEELPAGEPIAPPKPGWQPPARTAEDDSDLDDTEAMREVRAQQLEQETAIRIRDARQLLSTDPDRARDLLKEAQQLVRDSADLAPGDRDRLLRQLEGRIRESIVRSRAKLECDLAAERKAAIGRERDRLNTELQRREERIKQLVERYNALVEEGIRDGYAQSERYPQMIYGDRITGYERPTQALSEAERVVGDEIAREAPPLWANHPIPMPARVIGRTAGLVARTLDYHAENDRVRRDQERGFMDTLHLVDVAGIPYPDEPSIIYPNKERWKEISELRAKYRPSAFDPLSQNEKTIYEALGKATGPKFSFENNSLKDLKNSIEAQFGIPVVFDMKALEGFDLDEATLTENAANLPLRSALRQILRNIDMTYVVKDDVLRITTKEQAATDLVPRAYAVGDLVLPVDPMNVINPFNLGGANPNNQNNLNAGPGAGGGLGLGACWVAREVYGVHDPRWLIFRSWLTTEAPAWLRDLYIAHGPAFADWIHD
ncbi:MAG: VWA domain-containing protein, partial [Planctomycetaceae bacterium]